MKMVIRFSTCFRKSSLLTANHYGIAIWRPMSSASEEVILTRLKDKGIITLNRPKSLNALNLSMVKKIYRQLETWNADPEVNLIIVKGNGDKAFCAGGDIRDLAEDKGASLGREFFKHQFRLNHLIDSLSIPYVSLVDGITMGGGVGLSVHGRFRIATERTVFAMPETKIGFFPDVGGTHFMPRLPGKLGTYLGLTGSRLVGSDVHNSRIATHFVKSAQLQYVECELLNLENPTTMHIENVLSKFQENAADVYLEQSNLWYHMEKINHTFDGKTIEEIFHKLESEGSAWSRKQLNILKKLSPTSLKVTLKAFHLGSQMSLQDALQMEYRLTRRFLAANDFYEGVHSVIIDKDNEPKWKPSSLEEVTVDFVDEYFHALPQHEELELICRDVALEPMRVFS